jgi:hypothetical protein
MTSFHRGVSPNTHLALQNCSLTTRRGTLYWTVRIPPVYVLSTSMLSEEKCPLIFSPDYTHCGLFYRSTLLTLLSDKHISEHHDRCPCCQIRSQESGTTTEIRKAGNTNRITEQATLPNDAPLDSRHGRIVSTLWPAILPPSMSRSTSFRLNPPTSRSRSIPDTRKSATL